MAHKKILVRQSNFELLRILCMFGVLVGHVLITFYQDQIHSQDWSVINQGRVLGLNVCAVAVNCFVLISGFFSIRLSIIRVVKYVGQCFFYSLFAYFLFQSKWQSLLFPISESGLWFVINYFALMLISPILNAGVNSLSVRELLRAVSALLFSDIYLGYIHQQETLSSDGYNVFHLICIYCLGGLIARKHLTIKNAGYLCLICFFVMTLLHAIKIVWFPISAIYSLHFNSPMLILSSVLVFLWAKNLTIQSKVINWIASSVFAVYLIHCNPSFSPYFWQFFIEINDNSTSPFLTIIWITLSVVVFFMACVLLDKVRIFIFERIEAQLRKVS